MHSIYPNPPKKYQKENKLKYVRICLLEVRQIEQTWQSISYNVSEWIIRKS